MSRLDARKLAAGQQQALRSRAIALVREGMSQAQIVRELGVSRSAVAKWISLWGENGEKALASRPRGRPIGTGTLSPVEKWRILDILCNHLPEDFGLSACLWSNDVIRDFVHRASGISVTAKVASMWRRQWGFCVPRSESGDLSRYDDDVSLSAVWRFEEYPKIRRRARKQKAQILLMAESAMPERPAQMLSAIDGRGKLRFAVHHFPVTVEKRIDFLERLLAETGRPIFLLLDSHPNHNNGAIHAWQRVNTDRITLCHIPISDLCRLPTECWPFGNVNR